MDLATSEQKLHPLMSGSTFAIISGGTPHFIPENKRGYQGLMDDLMLSGLKHEPVNVNGHDHGFVVYNPTREQAMELGRKHGQESVIFSENGQHQFIYTNGPKVGKFHPTSGPLQFFRSRPADNGPSTQVPGLGYVRFPFDFRQLHDNPKKPLNPEGESMSDTKMNKGATPETSVVEFRHKLAKAIQNQISLFSQKLEDLRARELNKADNCPICGHSDRAGPCPCLLAKGDFQVNAAIQAPGDTVPPTQDEGAYHTPAHSFQVIGDCSGCGGACTDQDLAQAQGVGVCDECFLTGHPVVKAENGELFPPRKYAADDEEGACNCESTHCPHHNTKVGNSGDIYKDYKMRACPNDAGKQKMQYVGRVCDACAKHNQKFMAKGEDKSEKPGPDTKCKKCGKQHMDFDHKGRSYCNHCGHEDQYKAPQQITKKSELCKCGMDLMKCGGSCGKKKHKKSETFIDLKAEGKRATSTDDAAKGGPRMTDKGYATPDPVKATKPLKGKVDEGSGGTITKGKAIKKAYEVIEEGGKNKNHVSSVKELNKAATAPQAKPPTAAPVAAKPPTSQSNPGKAMTPKLPKPTMPKPKVPAMGAMAPQAPKLKLSEKNSPSVLKKFVNVCPLCNKKEHTGDCK